MQGHSRVVLTLIALVVCAASVPVASGEITVFTDEAGFVDVLSKPVHESFELHQAKNVVNQHDSFWGDGMTIGSAGSFLSLYGHTLGGAHATDGEQFMFVSSAAMSVTFSFNQPIAFFGLHITDWGDGGTGSISYADDAGHVHTIATTPQSNGGTRFFGISSSAPLTEVTIARSNLSDGFGIDNIYYQNVPSPTGLIILGTAGLVLRRRRR